MWHNSNVHYFNTNGKKSTHAKRKRDKRSEKDRFPPQNENIHIEFSDSCIEKYTKILVVKFKYIRQQIINFINIKNNSIFYTTTNGTNCLCVCFCCVEQQIRVITEQIFFHFVGCIYLFSVDTSTGRVVKPCGQQLILLYTFSFSLLNATNSYAKCC